MKILHIACIGLNAEGIGTVISKIVPEQIKKGNEVRIISTCDNLIYKELEISHITATDTFANYIQNWKPDIVQFHSVYRFPFIRFYKLLKRKGIPYVIQMHGALSEENYKKSHFKKVIANKLFFYSYLNNASAVLFLNKEEQDKCVLRTILKNSLILPNGCDKVNDVLLKETCNNPIDIIFIGRASMIHKGLDVLCDALDILMQEGGGNFKLSFYANPDDKDIPLLLERIKLYRTKIDYKGGIYGTDKDLRLRNTDIFILTSRYEGMPMGLLEAISYGIPSIVTPGTNMSDILKVAEAGWITDLTPQDIAKTIKKAIKDFEENPLRYRKNALKLSKSFNWDTIAGKSIEIYSKILNK